MERTLTLPRPLKDGAHAWLEVQVGPLAPGQRVRVTTLSGELLGAISPFGSTERRHSGVYSLPVPADAIRNGALSVRVTITDANKPARTPTDAEVQKPEIADSPTRCNREYFGVTFWARHRNPTPARGSSPPSR
jgi:hypothetical protein